MSDDVYMKALLHGLKELSELAAQQEELENQQRRLFEQLLTKRIAITGLGFMIGEEGEKILTEHEHLFPEIFTPDVGLTNAVRKVLRDRANYVAITPIQVRDYLKKSRFNLDKYTNALASIHTVLKRLYNNDEAEIDVSMDNKVAYKCVKKPQESQPQQAVAKKAVVKKAVVKVRTTRKGNKEE